MVPKGALSAWQSAAKEYSVTFPKPFAKPPFVVSDGGNAYFNVSIEKTTTTGCSLFLMNLGSGPNQKEIHVKWMALATE